MRVFLKQNWKYSFRTESEH